MDEIELKPETGIKNSIRKHITNSSLVYVLAMMVSMFTFLLASGPAIVYVDIGLSVVQSLAILWLAYGLYSFHKDEENKTIFITSITIGVAAIILLVSRFLGILYATGVISFGIISIGDPVAQVQLPVNITFIVSAAVFTGAFYILKGEVDKYAADRRNIYKGQLSLPIGFALLFIYLTIETIIPQETYAYFVGEGEDAELFVEEGFQVLLWVQYFFSMGNLVMIVLGFWYLRRAFATLDKIPEELFQRIEEARAQQAQARQQGGGMFGGRRGGLFGGLAPPPPVKPAVQSEEKIEDILIDDPSIPKKMFCVKCGLELDEDSAFCGDCGEPNPYLKKG